ncbi:ATP-dependent zinc metalloprotease FtsH [Trichococcus shcherbakoviae]|uniref:ATP-dependent zinc metalloprotease FtsH n=2 Tax=Trichococcus shcherbakoviae TaxID=2094020 RepID=A0A383TDL7_9LACT|nr:ATP-dependent zinc metalloprotease FtsH [Trichococcus shcherbakoviae]OUL09991.1 cell division protein FtsH [Sedimentibacter sp. SX930]TNV70139.1 ATP-dependent zinc metalloprotease FtsH [Trichococcus shcherbakoviae subsp. psychrophilus]SYZ77571.1 peptidase m41 ftsh extracellular [Trichococcus shcherbakoviae]
MKKNNFLKSSGFYVLIFLAIIAVVSMITGGMDTETSQEISASEFMDALNSEEVDSFTIQPGAGVYEISGEYRTEQELEVADSSSDLLLFDDTTSTTTKNFTTRVLPNDETLKQITDIAETTDTQMVPLEEDQSGAWISILFSVLPIVIFIFFMYMMMGQAGGGQGGNRNVMNFGKTKSEDATKKPMKVRFSDVAGAEEEKQELVEVVEFLKDPRRFTALGARIPAGVLLEGPPGTGKTLLAKAVAGEAGVPFFSISGSEFVEMFVGVGASRVRDLFEQAKKAAPAIIFIDEIDAVGRQRGAGMGGGHDEREQTLNQLLVEMDGFSGNEGIIVIAATNRSDVLDPALLRPGRFDRQILVGRPDVKGREAILKVHSRNKPLASNVDLKVVAQQTPGFSGADLENLLNEAALVAARRNKTKIDALDVDEAHDRVIAGPAKRDRVISKREREMVAYHEAGHTIVGMVLSDARIVHKVTIVPRGRAGGYAIMLPKEDRFLMTKDELLEQVVGLLGGRVAEEVVFNVQTTGASNDFEQATGLIRSMVTEYGMSEKLGTVQYEGNHQVFVGRDYGQTKAYSEDIAYQIDSEVRRMMSEAHVRARQIIEEHREQLNLIAAKLLELETLDEKTIRSLFETGQMPSDSNPEEFPSEKAQSFEEAKRALEKKEAEKVRQEEQMLADDESEVSSEDSLPVADEKAENEATDTEEK